MIVQISRLIISLYLLSSLIPSVVQADSEENGRLKASIYLQAEIRKGPYHSVEETIVNDGFLNHYQISSPFGKYSIASDTSLYRLIRELQAIALMQKVDTEDVALDSLKQSGEKTMTGLQNLFSDPEGTL